MDPVSAVLNIGNSLITRLFPDPEQRDKAKLAMLELQQAGDLKELEGEIEISLAQIRVNEKQAESGSLFVSGARPAIMWICAFILAYSYILHPFMEFFAIIFMESPPEFPQLSPAEIYPILMGLLGLGAMRTREKEKGVARSAL